MAFGDRQAEIEAAAAERAQAVMEPQPDFGALLGLPPLNEAQPAQAAVAKRRAGRPVGARNKRSESLAAEVERRFGNGIVRGYALATMPAEELAAQVGCTLLEAIQEQRLWLQTVAPYVHQRLPLDVNPTGRMVALPIGAVATAGGEGQSQAVALGSVQVVENQEVAEGDDAPV